MTEKRTRNLFQNAILTSATLLPVTCRAAGAALLLAAAAGSFALAQAPQTKFPAPGSTFGAASTLELPPLPQPTVITTNGSVLEDVVARINDQVITRTEYQSASEQLLQEAQQQNVSPAEFADRLHDLLRDMIDEQLLLSKGKELGITGDAETMRQLDDIRKKNNMTSMEDLQKAAAQQGVSFEDFKQHIRDQVVRQQVVRDEVGRRLNMTRAGEATFYAAHSQDFAVPEQLHLSEILIPTPDNPTDAQIAEAQTKADAVAAKLKGGAKFTEVAKTSSGGPTAAAGGDLGDFKRGALGDVLEKATFSLPVGANTDPIRTRQGFVILHVDSHQAAGVPPLADVEEKVQEAMYFDQLQPALRAYLTKAREDAYMEVAPGFVDSGSSRRQTKPVDIAYTAYKAPAIKKRTQVKQRMEQEKANKAQAELAAARTRVAEKQEEKAAEAAQRSGVKNVSMPVKPKKVHREKIRFGQAPQKALPAGNTTAEVTAGPNLGGQAPGVAMAPTSSVTSITTGVGADPESDEDALAKNGPQKKTRFAAHESEADEAAAKVKLARAEAKATTRPVVAAPIQDATEKHQAAPLGLNGDTTKKQKAPKRKKGDPKERLQEKPKTVDAPAPVAPTVNPNLGAPATTPSSTTTTTPPPQ